MTNLLGIFIEVYQVKVIPLAKLDRFFKYIINFVIQFYKLIHETVKNNKIWRTLAAHETT